MPRTATVLLLTLAGALTAAPARAQQPRPAPTKAAPPAAAPGADSAVATPWQRRGEELLELMRTAPIRGAAPLPPFQLRLLETGTRSAEPFRARGFRDFAGRHISSDTLQGRVGVLDFWGVWCQPCIADMPEIQRAWQRYRGDPDVVFLTIDYADAPETIRAFMAQHAYDFPVLLDDGYVQRAGVVAFPTILVVDRSGKKHFREGNDGVYAELLELIEHARSRGAPVTTSAH